MLSRRQLPFTWITLLIILCVMNAVLAKKHKHKHKHDDDEEEEDNDNDNDFDTEDDSSEKEEPEFLTPKNETWLRGLDLSDIKGRVRPVGSGVCKNAKCDGTDNDRCFESCGNMATEDDIYGCPSEKTWALTFDDGPSNFTIELLDILDKAKIKATFCVMGAHALQYPEIIKRAYDAGHQIASHTFSHPHLMSLTNEQIVYEVRATEDAILAATGVKPRYIRPPYGEADARVKSILKKMGYKNLLWNVDPTDYNVHMLKDGAQRIQKAFDTIAAGKSSSLNAHEQDRGFISLQHDLYKVSIAQVPKIIDTLQGKGYKFMTAAECVGDKEPHASKDFVPPVDEKKHDDEEKHEDDDEDKKDKKKNRHDDDEDDEDEDDDYSEDNAFAAASEPEKKEEVAQQQSGANSVSFSAAMSILFGGLLLRQFI